MLGLSESLPYLHLAPSISAGYSYLFSMLTKQLSTVGRVQLCFIELMYATIVRELPDGGAWAYEGQA
jgi:hypothetical protein